MLNQQSNIGKILDFECSISNLAMSIGNRQFSKNLKCKSEIGHSKSEIIYL